MELWLILQGNAEAAGEVFECCAHGLLRERSALREGNVVGSRRHQGIDVGVDAAKRKRQPATLLERQRHRPVIARLHIPRLLAPRPRRREDGIVRLGRRLRKGKGLEEAAVHDVLARVEDFGGEDVARRLVEEVADGDVAGRREDAVRGEAGGVDELGVAAGDEEGEEGEVGAGFVWLLGGI